MTLRKHVNCIDVAIRILKRFYVREKDVWKLKVEWWRTFRNRPPEVMNGDFGPLTERIEVPGSAMKDWKPYTFIPEAKNDQTEQADAGVQRESGPDQDQVAKAGKPEA